MDDLFIKYDIPESIIDIIDGLKYEVDNIGLSDSNVFVFEDYILKISSDSFELKNEVKAFNALKGKLPIARVLAYEENNGRAYLLKTKIKGKMLCDEEFLNNPELLFKLASDALKMLWSVDIRGLDLQNTVDVIIDYGKYSINNNKLKIEESDTNVTSGFKDFYEIMDCIINNKPDEENVICHGDFCLPNIIIDNNEIKGFIDLGLTGISHRYQDVAILYRSIKYNMTGVYGSSYEGFDENKLFDNLGIKRNSSLLRYYLLVDELLG